MSQKESEGIVTKKADSFIQAPAPLSRQDSKSQRVVWIRHAALKEHDLMIPMEGLNTMNDLRIQAQKKIGEVADGEVLVKELRRKNGELLDLKAPLQTCVKRSEVLVAISGKGTESRLAAFPSRSATNSPRFLSRRKSPPPRP